MAEHFTYFARKKSKLLAKNIARTARIQLNGRHLLFEEYLQNCTTLLHLLNLLINMQSKINLTSMEASMFWLVFKLRIILSE